MKLHISVLTMIIIWGILLTGCRDRYFSDRGAAVKYLEAHEQEFERVAEAWAMGVPHHPTIFCNPQGSPQNRPLMVTSKPANRKQPGHELFIP